jgi:hypothetical protein
MRNASRGCHGARLTGPSFRVGMLTARQRSVHHYGLRKWPVSKATLPVPIYGVESVTDLS